MTVLRAPLLGVLMALVMALTSQAMAVARAAPGPSGIIELCTGSGPVMVAVDADGQPVGHPHLCPDYAAHAFDLACLAPATLRPPETLRRLHGATPAVQTHPLALPRPQARGPPVHV